MSDAATSEPREEFPSPKDGAEPPPLSGHRERVWASMAHLLSLLSAYFALGFIAPLVIYLVLGPRSPFVRAHSAESLNFQLTALILAISSILLGWALPFVFVPLVFAYIGFYLISLGLGAVRAYRGAPHRYRLTFRFVST